jgi:hypothetical protein
VVEPVQELRQLRKTALQVNAACKRWSVTRGLHGRGGPGKDRDAELLSRCALVGWRLARVITGWLQSHPNWRLHPSECPFAEFAMRTGAAAESMLYLSKGSRLNWLCAKLDHLERRCADVRAITSSAAINDMLSRHQPDLTLLRRAVHSLRPRATAAALPLTAPGARAQPPRAPLFAEPAGADWPYLSF